MQILHGSLRQIFENIQYYAEFYTTKHNPRKIMNAKLLTL